jgi:iron complex outermembrane receptor protein
LGLDPELTYGGRFVAVGGGIGLQGPFDSPTPEKIYSVNAVFTADAGWGVSFGATAVDSMYAGYSRAVELPSYVVARGAIFYEGDNFSLRLNANNLFNEKYYTPQFLFWDVFVSPSVGPTAELSLTYKW